MKQNGSSIHELRIQGVVWHVAPAFMVVLGEWLAAHFPSVLEEEACCMKMDKGSRVAAADGFVLKERTPRKGRSGARFGLRRSGSGRIFRMAQELVRQGVRTPRPVAWATVRHLGIRTKDYFITEQIVAPVPLKDRLLEVKDSEALRAQLMVLLGNLLASFHVNGFSNRDLKDSNILLSGDDDPDVWAVDLDGVRRMRISTRRVLKDLWPIVRSLKMYGLGDENDKQNILNGHNDVAMFSLRMNMLPDTY